MVMLLTKTCEIFSRQPVLTPWFVVTKFVLEKICNRLSRLYIVCRTQYMVYRVSYSVTRINIYVRNTDTTNK